MSESNRIFKLEDAINAVQIEVEKAQAIVGDIYEDYFCRNDPNNKEAKIAILYDYRHYAILNGIVLDILKTIEDTLKQVQAESEAV